MKMKKTLLGAAVTMAMGASMMPQVASADIINLNWDGYFRMLDPNGVPLTNTSITTKGANKDETPITGTMTFDTTTGQGSGTMESFEFFGNSIPAEATGISMQHIGDGMGSTAGSLVLVNMIFNWGGNNGIPVSLVLDAGGFFGSMPTIYGNGYGANGTVIDGTAPGSTRGAVDGTYTGASGTHLTSGYMDLGAVPISTTKWNTTPTCTPGGGNSGACMGVAISGSTPLVADTQANANDFDAFFMGGTGASEDGMGGSPMLAGPFEGYHANFDVTSMTVTSLVEVTAVPVPAAAWLFGSGLIGLVGVARRRKAA